jgi:hypothetical protein
VLLRAPKYIRGRRLVFQRPGPRLDAPSAPTFTLGEVVAVHIDKAFIKDGVYQTALARPIARAGRRGDYFEIRPDAMFEMPRPD